MALRIWISAMAGVCSFSLVSIRSSITLAYATLGTHDMAKAAAFYDEVLGVLGAQRFMEEPGYFIAWGNSKDGAGLGITYPFDKQPATIGNGTMVALGATNREQVDAVYNKAMALGGSEEGAPGQRSPGFYAAYFRDLDGNKLNCCFMGE